MSQLMVTMRDGVDKVHTFELDSSELLAEIYFKLCESHHATLVRTLEPDTDADADVEPEPVAIAPIQSDAEVYTHPTMFKGSKRGYINLKFDTKPARQQLDILKACGFRWSVRHNHWYGLGMDLPQVYDAEQFTRDCWYEGEPMRAGAKPEPVKPEPVKPEPVKPEPVKPEPARDDKAFAASLADVMASM